jgi:hypothetical protein
MSYPRAFLRLDNFQLAFTRIVRAGNKEYKQFYRHLFPSYGLSVEQNLNDLISRLKNGSYSPGSPTVVYQPKKSGVLRPLTLLPLEDLIVYQAITNVIAAAFEEDQKKYALKRSFGALFAGPSSPFFYRAWKKAYKAYNRAIESAYDSGNEFVADFDLVSFYDLIDHALLRRCVSRRVKNTSLLDLLVRCLKEWTPELSGHHVNHGVPQGPEASAFLAECFLFEFDSIQFPQVRYFRYVDDITLMCKDEIPIRRGLLKLDLASKKLGLVPQAQKIDCRHVSDISEVLKSIPSGLAVTFSEDDEGALGNRKDQQHELLKIFRGSLKRTRSDIVIEDPTSFKFSLYRLNARREVLRRIGPLLVKRPDLSGILASYFKRFPKDEEAANLLLDALKKDPTYDASAANYIDAMDICEPESNQYPYRRVIQTATTRSEENSITLSIASQSFRGKRSSVGDATRLIKKEESPWVRGILIHRLFADPASLFNVAACDSLLQELVNDQNPDLARFAAGLLLREWPWQSWSPTGAINDSVARLLVGLGIRKRGPKRRGVLETFFQVRFAIGMKIVWGKALKGDFREAEKRCMRFQSLCLADPTARILSLDTFNEILLQNFAMGHPTLKTSYDTAAGNNKHPDYGNWLNNGAFVAALPNSIKWFQKVHSVRVTADLAHTRNKKTGVPTKPITFKNAETLVKGAAVAWADLISQWIMLRKGRDDKSSRGPGAADE